MAKLEDAASVVKAASSVVGVRDDEEDNLVLGTAVTAGADYLVTGDRGLLRVGAYGGVSIVTAREVFVLLRT